MILQLSKTSPKEGLTVVEMKGSIHTGPDCRRVEHEVEALLSSNHKFVIFDLSQVTHIDSAAIGSIVRCFSRLKGSGGFLRLAGCTTMITDCLKLTQLHKVLEIYPNVSAASESFPPERPTPIQ